MACPRSKLHRPAADVQRALYRRRVIVNATAGDVVRLLPPYVITEAELDEGLDRLRDALEEVAATDAGGTAAPAVGAGAAKPPVEGAGHDGHAEHA